MASIIYLNECISTNHEIIKYFTLNQNKETSVYTFNQTKGKGQYGNAWKMLANQNLAFSFCICKNQINCSNNVFNYHTALIFREFFANLTKTEVKIKWPNDLIINNKKIAGILIESKKTENAEVFIIGIGVNVLQTNFENLPKAGSILTQTGKMFDLNSLAENLYLYLSANLMIEKPNKKILQEFNNHLFKKDEIAVFELNKVRQNGIIKNADSDGFLWIELEYYGLRKFYHKEIELLY